MQEQSDLALKSRLQPRLQSTEHRQNGGKVRVTPHVPLLGRSDHVLTENKTPSLCETDQSQVRRWLSHLLTTVTTINFNVEKQNSFNTCTCLIQFVTQS